MDSYYYSKNIEKLNEETKSNFQTLLRTFGGQVKKVISGRGQNQPNQYVCAGMFSFREIENWDTPVFREAYAKLPYTYLNENVLLFHRLAFIFNNTNIHGERRLLQVDSKIRLTMEEQFVNDFGKEEDYIICMFSHYVPCTIPGHNCVELVRDFAREQGKQIIISYDKCFSRTNLKEARKIMKASKNVFCIPLGNNREACI